MWILANWRPSKQFPLKTKRNFKHSKISLLLTMIIKATYSRSYKYWSSSMSSSVRLLYGCVYMWEPYWTGWKLCFIAPTVVMYLLKWLIITLAVVCWLCICTWTYLQTPWTLVTFFFVSTLELFCSSLYMYVIKEIKQKKSQWTLS